MCNRKSVKIGVAFYYENVNYNNEGGTQTIFECGEIIAIQWRWITRIDVTISEWEHCRCLTLILSSCFLTCSSVFPGDEWAFKSASISSNQLWISAWFSLKCVAKGRADSNWCRRSALNWQTMSAWVFMLSSLDLISSVWALVVSRNILLHLFIMSFTAFRFWLRSILNDYKWTQIYKA